MKGRGKKCRKEVFIPKWCLPGLYLSRKYLSSAYYVASIDLGRGQQSFFVKSWILNILSFVEQMVSATTK